MSKKKSDKQFLMAMVGLFLLFATGTSLKLSAVIDWSWWLVTLPMWGTFAVLLLLLIAIWIAVAIERRKMDRRITITKRNR